MPSDVAGTFDLVSIAGVALPAMGAGEVVVATTWTLAPTGTWSKRTQSRPANEPTATPRESSFAGTWMLNARDRTIAVTTGAGSQTYTLIYRVGAAGRELRLPSDIGDWRYVKRP